VRPRVDVIGAGVHASEVQAAMNLPAPTRSKKAPLIATALITALGVGAFGYQAQWLDELSALMGQNDAKSVLQSRIETVSQGQYDVAVQVDELTGKLETEKAKLDRYERTLAKFSAALQSRQGDTFDFLGQKIDMDQAERMIAQWKISYDTATNTVSHLTAALKETREIQGRFDKALVELRSELTRIETLEAENERKEALNQANEMLVATLATNGSADDDVVRKQVRDLERRNRELETKSRGTLGSETLISNSLDDAATRLEAAEAVAKRGNGLDWLTQNFGEKPAASATPTETAGE
jgi:hypothetical protein